MPILHIVLFTFKPDISTTAQQKVHRPPSPTATANNVSPRSYRNFLLSPRNAKTPLRIRISKASEEESNVVQYHQMYDVPWRHRYLLIILINPSRNTHTSSLWSSIPCRSESTIRPWIRFIWISQSGLCPWWILPGYQSLKRVIFGDRRRTFSIGDGMRRYWWIIVPGCGGSISFVVND